MSELKTTIEKHEGGFTICNPYASKIKLDMKNVTRKSLKDYG